MSEFVPSGYLSIREALNRLGRELFPLEWTGREHEARRGLIGEDEWLRRVSVFTQPRPISDIGCAPNYRTIARTSCSNGRPPLE